MSSTRNFRRPWSRLRTVVLAACAVAFMAKGAAGADILQTSGFSNCDQTKASVTVQKVDISYNNDNKTVSFDVAGSSSKVQNVTAFLSVKAYGQEIYSNTFDPCDDDTFVQQLCPVPQGTFSARGSQAIPEQFASLVPDIAFQIPDIAAMATLQLESKDSGEQVACIQSQVSNGKTANVPAVSYVAAGVAGAALVLTGMSAVSAALAGGSSMVGLGGAGGAVGSTASAGGMGTISPSFTEVFGWFQGMAMNGMMSVNYPPVYRTFVKNFGFSTGLVPWDSMLISIDNFRAATGGNLTESSVAALRNTTLVFPDGSETTLSKRSTVEGAVQEFLRLARRQIETNFDTTVSTNSTDTVIGTDNETVRVAVKGIQAYVQELSIPSADTFMTVLLIVAIIVAAIVVGILLVKVILEFWALFGSFPKGLAEFRKGYWGAIARAITSLILLLYGIWVLYCVFQFTKGDSWAAKTLAGVTLALFTGILILFSWKIWRTARKLKRMEGDIGGLYEDKSIWVKYSLFYESYRRDYWWIFVPTIIYMFVKGFVLAAADGNGMTQTIAQLIVEGLMLILLLWSRPYERKSGNVINIIIQVVRVLSVACILVFVEQFGIAQTTQTVTGVVLIAIQSALTGILAILIAWNAILACCKENPHVKRRKEMEKKQRDTLTPLDARNSLLLDRSKTANSTDSVTFASGEKTTAPPAPPVPQSFVGTGIAPSRNNSTLVLPNNPRTSAGSYYNNTIPGTRSVTPVGGDIGGGHNRSESSENLVISAAPIAETTTRQPRLPSLVAGYVIDGNPFMNTMGSVASSRYGRPAPQQQQQQARGYGQQGSGYGGGGNGYGSNGYGQQQQGGYSGYGAGGGYRY